MRTSKICALAVAIMLLSMLCACRSAPRVSIPLIKVSSLGECGLCEWDVKKNEIMELGRPLFENSDNPHSLLYTFWDGHYRFILSDDSTKVLESNRPISVGFRRSSREAFYRNYELLKESDGSFTLKAGGKSRHFRIEARVSIDGEDVRGEQLGLSGFCVDDAEQTVSMLLNAFSFEFNRIILYVCRVTLADGASQIQEVMNCPTTFSPAFPPIGTNVLAIGDSFYVLSDTQVSKISTHTQDAETVFEVSTLSNSQYIDTKNPHGHLMTRLGYYDGRYVIGVVTDPQTASEANYLCLVDKGDVVAAIKVDSEYIAPNLWDDALE